MIKLMLITNQPDVASHAVAAGVNRIFVDLEILGKRERQGHLNTVISAHCLEDVSLVRQAIGEHELLVRVNPPHKGTVREVEEVIARGADLIMLPMFHTFAEFSACHDAVAGRAHLVPLVETVGAVKALPQIVKLNAVEEIYIGLNDLHLALSLPFMFQPLANGVLQEIIQPIKEAGKRFGFGGIARVGEGILPAEKIMSEHVRLGSSSVILSRTFHRNAKNLIELKQAVDLDVEITRLRQLERQLLLRSEIQIQHDYEELVAIINKIVIDKEQALLS